MEGKTCEKGVKIAKICKFMLLRKICKCSLTNSANFTKNLMIRHDIVNISTGNQ